MFKLLTHAVDPLNADYLAGDITFNATSTVTASPADLFFDNDNAHSRIDIQGATIMGGNITMTAHADTNKTTTDQDSPSPSKGP